MVPVSLLLVESLPLNFSTVLYTEQILGKMFKKKANNVFKKGMPEKRDVHQVSVIASVDLIIFLSADKDKDKGEGKEEKKSKDKDDKGKSKDEKKVKESDAKKMKKEERLAVREQSNSLFVVHSEDIWASIRIKYSLTLFFTLSLPFYWQILTQLAAKAENKECADCGGGPVTHVSTNLGCFLCSNCATMHRGNCLLSPSLPLLSLSVSVSLCLSLSLSSCRLSSIL